MPRTGAVTKFSPKILGILSRLKIAGDGLREQIIKELLDELDGDQTITPENRMELLCDDSWLPKREDWVVYNCLLATSERPSKPVSREDQMASLRAMLNEPNIKSSGLAVARIAKQLIALRESK